MPYLLNCFYLFALVMLSPWLLYKAFTTGKYRQRLGERLLGTTPLLPPPTRPRLWFHGVSVGEIHLLRQLLAAVRTRHPEWECVVSTTTDTGYEEACKLFPDLKVFAFPLDFSWAVNSAFATLTPDLVILAECELWPNFLLAARRKKIPVVVINARMSPRSAQRYEKLRGLSQRLFATLTLLAVQDADYAALFHRLGVARERLHVTGSIKYDGAQSDRHNPRTAELRRLFHVSHQDLVWICGSTQAPEEAIVLGIYQRLRQKYPRLRLILVPRQKDRFEEVAALLQREGMPFVRRSQMRTPLVDRSAIILGDTIGELGAIWGLADLAFVGGSLDGRRGGQNMIEPAAYGAAVVFGPFVWNFKDTVRLLLENHAAIQVAEGGDLEETLARLLEDAGERERLGQAARSLVRRQQGATAHTIALLEKVLHAQPTQRRVA